MTSRFWKKTELPSGGDDSHVCAGVKATNWFMPEKTLSEKGLSGGGSMVEMPVARTREETQQVANTHVQHVINTVEVEMPKINQMTKHIDVPPLQFTDKVVDIPVVAQKQAYMNWQLQKTMEIHQLQFSDEVSDVPVVVGQVPQCTESRELTVGVVQAPRVRVVAETTEIPQRDKPRCDS